MWGIGKTYAEITEKITRSVKYTDLKKKLINANLH